MRKFYRLFLRKFSEKIRRLRKIPQNGAAYGNRHLNHGKSEQELTRYFQARWVAFVPQVVLTKTRV
jgi:hypothetical protein